MSKIENEKNQAVRRKLLQSQVELDPGRHAESVRAFHDYFKLKNGSPDPLFLQRILGAFARLPYENVSKIIKLNQHFDQADRRIRLPEEVMEDHVDWHLGGTCFALTYFLQAVLVQNGFMSYPVMAHMRAGENIHTANIVVFGGKKYLVDPGYLLNHPMELSTARPRFYKTPSTGVELQFDAVSGFYNVFTFDHAALKWRYRFRDEPVPWRDFLSHWQASFFRPSMHGISLTRATPEGLIFVHKNFMREVRLGEKRNVKIKENYPGVIARVFGISPELVEQAQVALDENLRLEREWGLFKPKD